ncbi:MAG: hypothetical protein PVI72_11110, partial [Desulfobacterales bacterium]
YLVRYIHRHASRYAPLDVPFRRTQIRHNLVESFLILTLIPVYSKALPVVTASSVSLATDQITFVASSGCLGIISNACL